MRKVAAAEVKKCIVMIELSWRLRCQRKKLGDYGELVEARARKTTRKLGVSD